MIISLKAREITNTLNRLVVVFLLAMSISACGFHLRGNIPLPESIQSMYVQGPEGSFKQELLDRLESAGAQLASAPGGADVILNITQATTDRIVGTLDDRGKANSFNVRFQVAYDFLDRKGRAIRPAATLAETRRYDFDEQQIVESEAEEAQLQADLERSIALRIVRKLSSITDFVPER